MASFDLNIKNLNSLVDATRADSSYVEYYERVVVGEEWNVPHGVNAPDLVALDCEMVCSEFNSMDLGRVSLISADGKPLYEQLVIPEHKVIDWRTFISGCDEQNTKINGVTPEVARSAICEIIGENTIIVGHALHHDLQALKITHNKVIDTAFLFPAKMKKKNQRKISLPLRYLIHCLINKESSDSFDLDKEQIDLNSVKGIAHPPHDSIEDARWALDLVLGAMNAIGTGDVLDYTIHLNQPYLSHPGRPRAIGIHGIPLLENSQESLTQFVSLIGDYIDCHPVCITPPCYAIKNIPMETTTKKTTTSSNTINDTTVAIEASIDAAISETKGASEAATTVVTKMKETNDANGALEQPKNILKKAEEEEEIVIKKEETKEKVEVEEVNTIKTFLGVSYLLFSTSSQRDEFFNILMYLLKGGKQIKLKSIPSKITVEDLTSALINKGYSSMVSVRIPQLSQQNSNSNSSNQSVFNQKKVIEGRSLVFGYITFSQSEEAYRMLGISEKDFNTLNNISYPQESQSQSESNQCNAEIKTILTTMLMGNASIKLPVKGNSLTLPVDFARVNDFVIQPKNFFGTETPRLHVIRR